MSQAQVITRNGLSWLLIAQALVILPHLLHLPAWVALLWLGVVVWRVQIFRMRAPYPKGWMKALLLLVVVGGIVLSRGARFGIDSVVVLLVCTFILKVLEMRSLRDALWVVFLGFFCVAASYLFNDGIIAALYSLLPVIALLAALIGLQQTTVAEHPWRNVRLAGSLLLQAAPLMVVLFLVFPRLGPLWSLPVPSDKGVTGLSDNMAPADIAELSRSPALAFRASFTGDIPARDQLYWRALTLDRFADGRWSQSSFAESIREPQWQPEGEPLDYSVIMEATGKPWLMLLDVAQSAAPRSRMMSDFRWQRSRPIDRPLMYSARSWPQATRELQLPTWARNSALQLPDEGDPLTRQWAKQLRSEFADDLALVDAIMRHFAEQPYHYTLKPPALGANTVDDFLFTTQAGFCAHYAGAMTMLLRAAGIPARVVTGYQGGEINEAGQYVQVRQFDAHAWVEYWLEGAGWQRIDPTAAVAPERVELGLEQALSGADEFLDDQLLSPLRYRNNAWINALRLSWEELNYDWQRLVLGYQGEQQGQLLRRLFGELNWAKAGLWSLILSVLIIAPLMLWLFKPWAIWQQTPAERARLRFEKLLRRQRIVRDKGEGLSSFARRAAGELPEQAALIEAFSKGYERQFYAQDNASNPELKKALKALSRALRWRRGS